MAFKLAEAYIEYSSRGMRAVERGVSRIKSSLAGLMATAAKAGSVLAVVAAGLGVRAAIKGSAEYEKLAISLETVFGSADKARRMLDEINEFASKTPFEQTELGQASKVLAGFRVEQEQIIPVLRQLGDVAAITDSQLGDLVAIYGKMKSKGKLSMEEINQLAERGAASMQDFADVLGYSMEELPKKIERGEIKFKDFEKVLRSLTSEGGRFAGGMAKLSLSMSGLWSTFTGNLKLLLAEVGAKITEAFDLKGVVVDMGRAVEQMIAHLDDITPSINALAAAFTGLRNLVMPTLSMFATAFQAFNKELNEWKDNPLFNMSGGFFGSILEGMKNIDQYATMIGAKIYEIDRTGQAMLEAFVDRPKVIMDAVRSEIFNPAKWREAVRTAILEANVAEGDRLKQIKVAAESVIQGAWDIILQRKNPLVEPNERGKGQRDRDGAGGLAGAGGKGYQWTTLRGLTDRMQIEAGKRLAERTAVAAERTAVATEILANSAQGRAGVPTGRGPIPEFQ